MQAQVRDCAKSSSASLVLYALTINRKARKEEKANFPFLFEFILLPPLLLLQQKEGNWRRKAFAWRSQVYGKTAFCAARVSCCNHKLAGKKAWKLTFASELAFT